MPFNLGGPELIIILVIIMVVFGAGKLPNVMKDFGRGVKEFKKAQDEVEAPMLASGPAAPTTTGAVTTTATTTQPGPSVSTAATETAPRA